MKIGEIERTYYEMVGFYEHDEQYGEKEGLRKPFTQPEDNLDEIAWEFYDCIFRDASESTEAVRKIIEKQREGIRYLKEYLAVALLSNEPFIRKIAEIIYNDKRTIP